MPKLTPTNKKAADLAYERAEDQRALVIVLECAENWASGEEGRYEQFRAAIDRVRAHMLTVTEPKKPTGELPGQIGIDGSVVGSDNDPDPLTRPLVPLHERVPIVCPACNKDMLNVLGTNWTPLSRGNDRMFRLQCGFCAHIEQVTEVVVHRVIEERRRAHADSDMKKMVKPGREKRIRGAG